MFPGAEPDSQLPFWVCVTAGRVEREAIAPCALMMRSSQIGEKQWKGRLVHLHRKLLNVLKQKCFRKIGREVAECTIIFSKLIGLWEVRNVYSKGDNWGRSLIVFCIFL
jgi:hypothetical protein